MKINLDHLLQTFSNDELESEENRPLLTPKISNKSELIPQSFDLKLEPVRPSVNININKKNELKKTDSPSKFLKKD